MELALHHLLALFATFLFIIAVCLRLLGRKPQSSPSSPFSLPIIGHLHLLKQPIHRTLAAIAARYGPILLLRFGSRPVLIISSPSAAEECFSKHDVIFASRPINLSGHHFGYAHTALIVAPYGPGWRSLRRFTVLHALSPSRLPSIASDLRSLLRGLNSAAREGNRRANLRSVISDLMVNVMMGMIAGKRYYGEGSADPEEGRRFRRAVEAAFLLSGTTCVEDFIPAVKWLPGVGNEAKKMKRLEKEMDELYQELVDERRRMGKWKKSGEEEEQGKPIIDIMLALQEKQPEEYNDVAIKGMIASLVMAGTETSSGTMEWAMALLLNNPQAMKKVKAEIDQHVGRDRLLTESHLPSLRYLHNVIKETLRLFPPGPLLVPRESSERCNVAGFDIPRGTMLLTNVYAMQRDANLWEDPSEFKPERFEEDAKIDGGVCEYIPFGYGRRRCPGESMAWRVTVLSVGAMIQCFQWERVGEELVDLTEGLGLSMPMAKPLEAVYKPWPHMVDLLSRL